MAKTMQGSPDTEGPKKSRRGAILVVVVAILAVVAVMTVFRFGWVILDEMSAGEVVPSTPVAEGPVVAQGLLETASLQDTAPPATVVPEQTPTTTIPPTTTTIPEPPPVGNGEPGSCLILEQVHCARAVAVEWTTTTNMPDGGIETFTFLVLAFEVPPGTPFFAPADGEALYMGRHTDSPAVLGFEGREVAFAAFFIRNLESPEIGSFWEPVKEGEVIGFVSQFAATGGKDEVDPSGDYNLIVSPSFVAEAPEIVDINDFERQRDLTRWFWEGWFGVEARPFIIES